jgi:hypothetical protein
MNCNTPARRNSAVKTRNKWEETVLKSCAKYLVASLLLAPAIALAAPITVDFTITSTGALGVGNNFAATEYNGFALGTIGTGSFTIDDSMGNYSSFDVGITPIDFSLDWAGVSFDETTAQLWSVAFNGTGGLNYWGFGMSGGQCTNLNCISAAGLSDFYASGYTGLETGVAAVHETDVYGWMSGSLTWSVRPTSVPEPATLGLLCFGLLGAAAARRKRAAA